jgi:hypothetical protein
MFYIETIQLNFYITFHNKWEPVGFSLVCNGKHWAAKICSGALFLYEKCLFKSGTRGWRYDSSCRAPALQLWSREIKLPSDQINKQKWDYSTRIGNSWKNCHLQNSCFIKFNLKIIILLLNLWVFFFFL